MFWIFDLKDVMIVALCGTILGMIVMAANRVRIDTPPPGGERETRGGGVIFAGLALLIAIGFAVYLLAPMVR